MHYKFIKVKNLKYSKYIYDINSNYSARKFSSKPKKFSYRTHLSWIKNVLKNKLEVIFLIKIKNNNLGIIRKKKVRKRFDLSWIINKNFRNKGHGKKILKKFVTRKKIKYVAKIHNLNIASIKIAQYAGFKKQRQSKIFSTFTCN